jgi:hypothetical protein
MLRLARDGGSSREIARVLGVARSSIKENPKRAMDAGLSWPLPGELTDDKLEQRLFGRAGVKQGTRRRPEPNWAELAIDLKKPGDTMMVRWEGYRAAQPERRVIYLSGCPFAVSSRCERPNSPILTYHRPT